MLQISVKNIAGEEVKQLALKEALFAVPANDALLHQVYVALSANVRQPIAHTKDRSERSGSGIKPWQQKGTGRARAGSVRSPIWRKGGITFGPTKDRNFSKATTAKMRQKAVLVALSEKVRANKLVVLDTLTFSEQKTKRFAESLKRLGIAGRSLMLSLTGDERVIARLSRNIEKVDQTLTENLNLKQLLDREYLLLSEAGVKCLEQRFASWEKQ